MPKMVLGIDIIKMVGKEKNVFIFLYINEYDSIFFFNSMCEKYIYN